MLSIFFREFFTDLLLKEFRALPIMVAWGVWMARMHVFFKIRIFPLLKSLNKLFLYCLTTRINVLKRLIER
jgi:hypothetical protein